MKREKEKKNKQIIENEDYSKSEFFYYNSCRMLRAEGEEAGIIVRSGNTIDQGKNMKKKIRLSRKTQKIILAVCIAAAVLLSAGLFIYIKVSDTGTLGRSISVYGLDVSKLNAEEAEQKILRTFLNREVVFQEDGEEVFRTTMQELGYSLDEEVLKNSLQALQVKRAANRRIFAVEEDYKITYQVIKDEDQEKTVLAADSFGGKERTASTDAYISYDEEKKEFVLVNEVQGNQIDEERLVAYVNQTLDSVIQKDPLGREIEIALGTEVYQQPVSADSQDMQTKLSGLNQQLDNYRNATVTYTFGETTEVLGSDVISSWIKVEGETISIDQAAAEEYIANLAASYNTIYVPRTFHTSYGNDVTVSSNEYGFQIDQAAELTQLLADIESGQPVTRDPVYSISGMQRNGRDDLAGSYIEVSLDNQHLWLYKDGALITETDIVSGAPTPERETYRGAWPIAYKASPFTLTSDVYGYNTEVTYWMPFVYGQGLHDASWQSAFGGNLYKTGAGSHGCINLPTDQAALIYNTIDGGYPIIIY